MVAKVRRAGEVEESVHGVQSSSYKMNKFWDVMYSMVTIAKNIVLHI